MGSGYIKVDKKLIDDPRLIDLAHILAKRPQSGCTDWRIWHHTLVGVVVHLWTLGDTYADSGDKLPVQPQSLWDILGTPEWIVRLLPGDWLLINDGDNSVTLPGYCARNGIEGHDERKETLAIQRVRWREKKRRQRAEMSSQGQPRDNGGTKPGTQARHTEGRPPSPGPGTGTVSRSRTRTRRAAAPSAGQTGPASAPPEDPIEKLYRTGGFQSATPEAQKRSSSFESEFSARFGSTPEEAHERRKKPLP